MTPGIEEYLEALYHLVEAGGPVKPKELADKLEVSPASAAEMTKRLVADNLVSYVPYKGIEFTEAGRRAAKGLVRRHRLSERFLADILGLPWEEVHDEACKFEHVISDKVEDRLAEALGHPETCPHGNPIPGAKQPPAKDKAAAKDAAGVKGIAVKTSAGTKGGPGGGGKASAKASARMSAVAGVRRRRPRLVKLADLRPGQSGIIAKITEERPKFLKYLASLGLLPEVPVCVEEVAPFEGPILARVGSASYALGREVAGQIWVEKSSQPSRAEAAAARKR